MASPRATSKHKNALRWGLGALALAIAAAVGWEIGQPDEVPVRVSETARPVPADTSALQTGALPALAQQAGPRQESFGPYRVEYTAVHSQDLPAASLEAYGIRPDANTGIVTLRVLSTAADPANPAASVPAEVKIYKRTLSDQLDGINMRRIEQDGYLSYIGTYSVRPPETLRFSVEVTPEKGPTHQFNFEQPVYPR